MGQLPLFVLLVQGNNLAQVPSLPSNHFTAFIFPDICLYISVPHKGAIISPCTLWRSNTKTGDTPPTQGSKLKTVLLCFSTQQVLSGSVVSPRSTCGSAQPAVLQNQGPARGDVHLAVLDGTSLEGSGLKCFMKLGEELHGSLKAHFGA